MAKRPTFTMVNWYRLPTDEMDRQIRDARKLIDHNCDGPITAFVLIARATRRDDERLHPEAYANALHDAMLEYGYLSDVARD